MIAMVYIVFEATIKLILIPGTPPALAPVLPGIEIPGAPKLSFWHWIITIFVAAVIHEFSHGVIARVHKIPIKSSGFAFLGPILAAFVEPDEEKVSKASSAKQLSVFAAGPFSNILLGIAIILITIFLINPLVGNLYDYEGINVHSVLEDYPMADVDIELPFTITEVNGVETLSAFDFLNQTKYLKPGEEVTLTTDKGEVKVTPAANPDNGSIAYFGISGLQQKQVLKAEHFNLVPYEGVIDWFKLLLMWLFIINIGIGLFNLLPLGPVDGGRMFYIAGLFIFKDETKARKALTVISLIIFALIVINMIPWITKLFLWIWSIGGLLLALLV